MAERMKADLLNETAEQLTEKQDNLNDTPTTFNMGDYTLKYTGKQVDKAIADTAEIYRKADVLDIADYIGQDQPFPSGVTYIFSGSVTSHYRYIHDENNRLGSDGGYYLVFCDIHAGYGYVVFREMDAMYESRYLYEYVAMYDKDDVPPIISEAFGDAVNVASLFNPNGVIPNTSIAELSRCRLHTLISNGIAREAHITINSSPAEFLIYTETMATGNRQSGTTRGYITRQCAVIENSGTGVKCKETFTFILQSAMS